FDDRELLALRDDTLLRYHFKTLVLATGANPQTPPITGNDLPGIISLDLALSAARYGISPGREIVFAFDKSTDPATFEQATQLAEIFGNAGFEVKAALGISKTNGAFKRAIPTFLEAADGTNSLENVTVDGETLSCDALIWCGRSLPAYELARQCGVDVRFESSIDGFLPQVGPLGETARSDLYLVGEVTGRSRADAAQHAQALAEHLIPQIVKINQEAQPNGSTR
ncbi:hypothetical protein KAI87_00150, partial [Myxococcota bacterium]|nr:hypothetical protein [Myxococcota bacterium]